MCQVFQHLPSLPHHFNIHWVFPHRLSHLHRFNIPQVFPAPPHHFACTLQLDWCQTQRKSLLIREHLPLVH
jgi:hypothetical protein